MTYWPTGVSYIVHTVWISHVNLWSLVWPLLNLTSLCHRFKCLYLSASLMPRSVRALHFRDSDGGAHLNTWPWGAFTRPETKAWYQSLKRCWQRDQLADSSRQLSKAQKAPKERDDNRYSTRYRHVRWSLKEKSSRNHNVQLRIDNRRQSVILLAWHYSLAMYYRESYYTPNESLYFCLSNHINEITITLIFQKV